MSRASADFLVLTHIGGLQQGLLLVDEPLGIISSDVVLLGKRGGLKLPTAVLAGGLEVIPLLLDLLALLSNLAVSLADFLG